jgi:K+-transporting ATPase ATPase C chain
MIATFRPLIVVFVGLSLVTGVAYPLAITLVSQVAFHHGANGSIVERDGKAVGSELIAQPFTGPQYFWSRPSAAGYNGGASTGSNYGPTNPAQLDAVKQRVADLKAAHGEDKPVPIDLVTASGSGLDPHITPAAAEYQVARVARVRGMSEDAVRGLLSEHTEGRTFGILGEPRVNVLMLNLALDEAAGPTAAAPARPDESDAATMFPRRFNAGRQ